MEEARDQRSGNDAVGQFEKSNPSFDFGVYRIHALKWIFPQEKATFYGVVMLTSEAKMLYSPYPFKLTHY
jgi:hypothetical protein